MSDYADKSFFEATFCLATGLGDLRQRLKHAADYLTRLMPEQFPDDETRKRWAAIWDDLCFAEDQGGGRIEATVEQLLDEDAAGIAQRIYELHVDLTRCEVVRQERR